MKDIKVRVTLVNYITDTEVLLPQVFDSVQITHNLVRGITEGKPDVDLLTYRYDLNVASWVDPDAKCWTDFIVDAERAETPELDKACQ